MRCRTNRGFTLIEVMVSLTIMLMVVTVAFAGLRIGLNAWERGGKAIDAMDRRATLERLILRQLAVAYPTPLSGDENSVVLFRGSAQKIEFVSDYSLADGASDFRKIGYLIEDGRFFYGERSAFRYLPTDNELPPAILLANFKQASFEYLGSDDKGKPVWLNAWPFSSNIPPAVRVHLDNDTFLVRLVNRP